MEKSQFTAVRKYLCVINQCLDDVCSNLIAQPEDKELSKIQTSNECSRPEIHTDVETPEMYLWAVIEFDFLKARWYLQAREFSAGIWGQQPVAGSMRRLNLKVCPCLEMNHSSYCRVSGRAVLVCFQVQAALKW